MLVEYIAKLLLRARSRPEQGGTRAQQQEVVRKNYRITLCGLKLKPYRKDMTIPVLIPLA